MRRILLVVATILFSVAQASADEARLLRFPDVHGDKIAFVYAGNLYTAPRAGGQAVQLTAHEGLELFPKFSPDGESIAFTGQYDGDMSVYVIPSNGGEPTRLTYHPGIQNTAERFGPENVVMGWFPGSNKVLFRSRKENQDLWDGRAYLVDVAGGLPEALPMATAGFTSFSPDGKKVAYCPIYRDFRTWKRYKGGMAQDVWIFDLESLKATKITDWVGTDNMPMWYQDKIYFNSDRAGTLNLYCYDVGTGETRQVTDFTEYDVRWPSLGPDGIAFENGGYVYVMDLPSETVNQVPVELATDQHQVRSEYVDVSDKVRDYDISPDGKRAVFRARGDLFSVPAKEGITRNLTNSSGANDMYPRWSPDGKWIAYASDGTGEDEFYVTSADGKETIRLTTDGSVHRYAPEWSPDSKRLVFSDNKLRLFSLDVGAKQVTQIDKADRNEIRDFSWSPDSRYVAYTKRLENGISAVFVYSFIDNSIHQVTPGNTNDYSPTFDPNGEYLYFTSERDFNPILSAYEFSMANNGIEDLFLIVLKADGKSPFAPRDDEVMSGDNDNDKAKDEDKDRKEKTPPSVTIDFDNIYEREVAFELPAGNYRGLAAIDGAVFYITSPLSGLRGKISQEETVLHKYDMEKRKNSEFLTSINGYRLSADGKKMLIAKGGNYYIACTAGDRADLSDAQVKLGDMEMHVDRKAEFAQMFDQVWRRERDYFYDSNMHGVDWKKIHDRYSVLVPYAANRFDLTYLIGEMIGELCCSHTYTGGGDTPRIPSSGIGLLGVDFAVDHQANRIKITHILEGQNWDKQLRSPLREPGIDVHEGDYLLAINGVELTAAINPYSLTQNTVGKLITLTVNEEPTLKGAREVMVTPIASEEKLRYFNWVEHNRKYVDSASNGQIGYIHIPDMGGYGLVQFTKQFYNQLRKPGLIIDVRYNGGGFVSGLILERLRRTVVAMGSSRNFAPGRAPDDGLHAHMITLLNQFSCSDGDYFPYFFRAYKLGPLMGKRSWGGVIGIRGMDRLIDGGYYTVPEWSIYSLDGKWIMENEGVHPDIEVDNPPGDVARGIDDQLIQAVGYVTDELAENPEQLPPPPGPPTPR